jgi:hypothetical protein
MAANPQFASSQQYFRRGNGSVRERTFLLENLFLIRIGSRDPGPHILAKQCLVGAGGEPFAFSRFRVMAAATRFLVAMVCFFIFRSPFLSL